MFVVDDSLFNFFPSVQTRLDGIEKKYCLIPNSMHKTTIYIIVAVVIALLLAAAVYLRSILQKPQMVPTPPEVLFPPDIKPIRTALAGKPGYDGDGHRLSQ